MSDKERLNLLKEVAGTNVYEQKRAESTRIMEETDSKRAKIAELLDTIEERLDELESEKEELKEYQAKDQDRRCLEYALHQKELDDATASLEKIEQEKNQEIHNSNERRREFNDLEARIQVSSHSSTTSLTTGCHRGIDKGEA
jgi:structural maintenance of chromosome 3 (chondroitin sulfate proteoglycan 6)